MSVTMHSIEYRDGSTELTGVLFRQSTKRPGVLVVHGGAGLDDHARDRARRFSELGYVVFACDMYGNGVAGNRERVMARINELRADNAKLCHRACEGVEVLRPETNGHIAAVGYCFGGMTVLELARSGLQLAAVVSVHGSLNTSKPAATGTVNTKVLVCHGALDPHVPMAHVTAFIEEMNGAGADYQMIVYGGAMHGFTHETGPKIPGVEYHALADARSATAIRNFLREVFDDPPYDRVGLIG